MPNEFAKTPEPPYYVVIFTSQHSGDTKGYAAMSEVMGKLANESPGMLAMDSVRGADGRGITVAYFRDEASILTWKQNAKHLGAQRMGIERWYSHYEVRVAKVERAYSGPEDRAGYVAGDARP